MTADAELIDRILAGQSEVYAELVKKYQLSVYAIGLQRLRSAAAAEEVAQLVFVTAYRNLFQLADREKFGTWLRTIAVRQCGLHLRSEARKRKKTCRLAGGGEAAARMALDHRDAENRLGFDIEPLIGELPDGLRAAAVLCLVEGRSPAAAAAVLGLKPGTLRKRLFDVRARLQRQIVAQAEKESELHLLPRDFAERCVCRCHRAVPRGKEVMRMADKKGCGCGCVGKAKVKAGTKAKGNDRTKKKKEK